MPAMLDRHRIAPAPAQGWRAKFADPIPIAGGRPLIRLADAARYIALLPTVDREAALWRIAARRVERAAIHDDEIELARLAMLHALHGREQKMSRPETSFPRSRRRISFHDCAR
jgi:hypothetical protein